MNTVMSTTIIPDIYRHIARKSTVSRNVKTPSNNVSLCNPTFNIDNNCKEEQSIFQKLQCNIKLEKDSPERERSFVIIPENEIEQMNIEQTNEEIIFDIVQQIQNQISEYFTDQIQNVNQKRTISTDTHQVVNFLIDHVDDEESINTTNDIHMQEVSMESNQQSSILSRSQIDEDIVEIEVSPSCTCQCHQSTSNSLLANPSNEYLLFEQVLRQTRQEQQQQKQSLDNNHLIQTLKRQHQELVNLYHRQIHINKTDREQQTMQINQQDSQIQTDLSTIQQQQQNHKPNNPQVNGTHSTPNLKGPTSIAPRPFNSFLTPIRTTGPSLQQLIPCLTTTSTATTMTVTNKTSMIKKATTANSHTSPLPPSSAATTISHDFVDLTEEEDDNANTASVKKISPLKPQQSPTSVSTTAAGTARNQPANRLIRPNNTVPLTQTFSFRPLPEHSPCDHTIARPQLSITHDNTTVRLTWNLPSTPMESIKNYEIYAYKQNAASTPSDWRKIGNVNSMRLPMAVTLKEFQSNSHYAFAVRAVSINNNIGPFCEPKTIFTGNTLNTNQTVDSSMS